MTRTWTCIKTSHIAATAIATILFSLISSVSFEIIQPILACGCLFLGLSTSWLHGSHTEQRSRERIVIARIRRTWHRASMTPPGAPVAADASEVSDLQAALDSRTAPPSSSLPSSASTPRGETNIRPVDTSVRPAADCDELAALAELRSLLPAGTDEHACLRFLRACRGDVRRAAIAFGETADWRAEQGLEPLTAEGIRHADAEVDVGVRYSDAIEQAIESVYDPVFLDCYDNLGRPVVYVRLARMDCAAAGKQGVTTAMLLRRHVGTLEKIQRAVHLSPAGPMAGHLLVHDLEGCTISKFLRSRSLFRGMLHIDQKFYPELLGKLVCIRAPQLGVWAFHQIKPLIDPRTAAKVEMHTGTSSRSALAHLLPLDRLPC
mmetsp:Transcript_22987/g.50282  ORF Transcript_22987/g.50282 Transcript_22987/m.50282 type:complete len:377 (+) Transcript_22987:198-1328(+)